MVNNSPDDFQTESYAVDCVAPFIPLTKMVWECAAGNGNLARRFSELGYLVTSSDIKTGADFLSYAYSASNGSYDGGYDRVNKGLEDLPGGYRNGRGSYDGSPAFCESHIERTSSFQPSSGKCAPEHKDHADNYGDIPLRSPDSSFQKPYCADIAPENRSEALCQLELSGFEPSPKNNLSARQPPKERAYLLDKDVSVSSNRVEGASYKHRMLTIPNMSTFDVICTNPPFSLKDEFLEKCYWLGKPFALLLPLTVLDSVSRRNLFSKNGVEFILPPRRIRFETPNHQQRIAEGKKPGTGWFYSVWVTWGLNIGQQLTFLEE